MKKRVLASFFLSLSLMLSACSGGGSAPAGDSKPRSEGASQTEGKSELIVAVDQE